MARGGVASIDNRSSRLLTPIVKIGLGPTGFMKKAAKEIPVKLLSRTEYRRARWEAARQRIPLNELLYRQLAPFLRRLPPAPGESGVDADQCN